MPRRLKRDPGWRRNVRTVQSNLDALPENLESGGGTWAIGVVRDEADIIETVVRNLLDQGIERVVVADNLSTDGTASILEGLARSDAVTVLSDRLAAHYQAEKMTLLARAAMGAGAGWVLPFDADEVWLSHERSVSEWLDSCEGDVVQVPVFNYIPMASDDSSETDPVRRIRWRKTQPNRLHKVAFRPTKRLRLAHGNHGVSRRGRRVTGLEIRHFPYRSEDQFLRKLRQGGAALAATDLSSEVGKNWRGLGSKDDATLRALWESFLESHNLPSEWWVPREGLVEDPVVLARSSDQR